METTYIVLPLIGFIINILLAGLVVKGNWRSFRHIIVAAFLTAMALWGLTIFGMRSSPNLAAAFQWEKAALCVIPLVSILFYHFCLRYTYTRTNPWVLRGFYSLGGLMVALSLLGAVATEMQQKWYGYAPVLGAAFPIYLLTAYVPTILALRVLISARGRSRDPDDKNRLSYIILAAALSLIGGTTDFLPVLGLNIYPMGIVSNIVFGVLTTIAVTRYQLLELRVLLRRGLAYSLISTIIFGAYGLMFLLFFFVFQNRTTPASIAASAAALILVTIVLPPGIGIVQRMVDRLFFRERYDHLQALLRFTHETREIGDVSGLAKSLTGTVRLAMQADWVDLLLPQPEGGDFTPADTDADLGWSDGRIKPSSPLARWLSRNERALRIEELGVDPYLQVMSDAQRRTLQSSTVQLIVPMKSKGQLTGILALGPKVGEDAYSRTDIALLTSVTNQAATIIENSRLYSQEMARLRELEQLESLKSNLLRTVSHELKSPLTAIKTSVELLFATGSNLDGRTSERLLRALRSGVLRFERLVDESLDYARMQSAQLELRLELTDLAKVVDEAVGLVAPSITAKQQTAIIEISPDLPKLLVDARRIERVFLNLLNNANKFAPVGGEISLRMWQEGSRIIAEITDNGIGIPEDQREFLFHEFYRGPNADLQGTDGTGLGLAISKFLVELHGGEIGVKSSGAKGITFHFSLPIAPTLEEQLLPLLVTERDAGSGPEVRSEVGSAVTGALIELQNGGAT